MTKNSTRRIKITKELSEQVGWRLLNNTPVQWPTLEAIEGASDFLILFWFRNLPAARTPEQFEVIHTLCEIFGMNDEPIRSTMGDEDSQQDSEPTLNNTEGEK